MKQEEQTYFSITDIINTALSNPRSFQGKNELGQESDISLNVMSDLTYSNIWNSFTKWCMDQTELGFYLEIFMFCDMFYVSERPCEGIVLSLSNYFLKEHGLTWDEENSPANKQYQLKYASNEPQKQKINYIAISGELNTKKIIVQNGLNNLFKAIGYLLQTHSNCQIDLGVLGTLTSVNRLVSQTPNKVKGDAVMNKKTTIKSLIGRRKEAEEDQRTQQQDEALLPTLSNKEATANEEQKVMESDLLPRQPKVKITPKKGVTFSFKTKFASASTTLNGVTPQTHLINIPMPDSNWHLKDMLNSTFKRVYIQKPKANPVLFNVYSNTKAAPFTAEKTQIPLSHRIGSFYSLSLQNFIIDKTTKSVKRLYDDYFEKFKNIKFDEPATEDEEYYYVTSYKDIDEKKIKLRRDTHKRYKEFIAKSISDSFIAEMKTEWLLQIVKMANRPYNMKIYESLLNSCLREITQDYKVSMKTSILDYILKHPEQREKLSIPVQFRKIKEYAEEKVTRPSDGNADWKTSWNRNKLTISNNLYIMCENITKILKYFEKTLKDTSYLDIDEHDITWSTLKLTNFVDNQRSKLEAQKQIVNEDWRKYVENILKENKIYKDQLILYFNSVSGLMSSQLRKMIIGSIERYYNFMKLFKQTTYLTAEEVFTNQYETHQPFQRSFIEIDIKEHPDGDKFTFSEELNDIHAKLSNVVKDIIRYSQGVERPDNMFIKNIDKHSNLWQVPFVDSVVSEMYNEIDAIITENLEVISKVTELYEPFEFVMKEKEAIKTFLASSPSRDDFRKRIQFYEDKEHLLSKMPNNLYMNMIKINCSEINETIRTKINESINDLLKSIQATNILAKSKFLGEECEKLFAQFDTQISDEKILYELENIFETCRSETVPHLFNEYEDFLEWVFFYLSYDTYNVFEAVKDNNTFEQSIKGCHYNFNRIEKAMKNFSDDLENQKKKFTNNLDQERAKLLEDITTLKFNVDDYRENIKTKIFTDDRIKDFLAEIEQLNATALDCKEHLLIIAQKEGYLGNAFTTEDERVDQCIFDLEPMINYFKFINDFRNYYKKLRDQFLWQISFTELDELLGKYELFDVSMQKISTYKDRIAKAKGEFDDFRNAVDHARMIYPLMEVFKNQDTEEDDILIDNQKYCFDASKYFPSYYQKEEAKDVQTEFLNFKFIDIQRYIKIFESNRVELEKIIEEWQIVYQMHSLKEQMKRDISGEFVLEKYNKKEYHIVSMDNFNYWVDTLKRNLEITDEKLNAFDTQRTDILGMNIFKEFKMIVTVMLENIVGMKERQEQLVKYMDRTAEIKKRPEAFQLLKQAEKLFKNMVDVIFENQLRIQTVFNLKEQFKTFVDDLAKLYKDIEKTLAEAI